VATLGEARRRRRRTAPRRLRSSTALLCVLCLPGLLIVVPGIDGGSRAAGAPPTAPTAAGSTGRWSTAPGSDEHGESGGAGTRDGDRGGPWAGPPGWTSPASCRGSFGGPAAGSLVKTTSAGPDDATVLPGQRITVTLTWKAGDFVWGAPAKVADCVEIGSQLALALTQLRAPGSTDGTATFTYRVPGGTGGQQVCDRGVAWGRAGPGWSHDGDGDAGWGEPGTERSAVLCYTILAASAPEVPQALLLPVAGLAIGTGAFVFVRRRRRAPRHTS